MVPKKHQQGVRVLITTYKTGTDVIDNRMDLEKRHVRTNTNKFICSICLNAKGRNYGKVLCTACQKGYNVLDSEDIKDINKREDMISIIKANKDNPNMDGHNRKYFVKQETEYSQGLNLLNEVLTVFKNKKQNLENSKSSKTLFKDVSTSTDNINNLNARPRLVLSKVFLCSIEGNKNDDNCKFTVVNSSQPDYFKKEFIIDLKKHKSSSIPQMRIDELKNSLREKTKSKDINEEVNRMFATVTMNSLTKVSDHSNRPVIRKGPRVLPVVKTKTNQDTSLKQSCKCCQTSEYCLSSGDSFVKPNINQKKWKNSDYISCCHCQKNHRRTQTDVVICQNCHNVTEKRCDCEKSFETNYCNNVE